MVHGGAVGGTGTMLAVASDLQNSLLMMGRSQAPGKRPRVSRPNLSHLSAEEKLEVRLGWARVWLTDRCGVGSGGSSVDGLSRPSPPMKH